jgi:sulfur-oxidizing protein SoxY
MNPLRRTLLKLTGAAGTLALAVGAGLLRTGEALAAAWNKTGFESKAVADALKSLGAVSPTESKDIIITAPDIAENGAVVPVAVTSKIPHTQSIAIIAEKNPFPLSSTYDLSSGGEAYVSIRIKLGETSNVRAVIKADGKFYTAVKEVKVTIGGCGG